MKGRRLSLLTVVVCALIMFSCKPQVPSKYIQPDDMEDILYDYHLSHAIAEKEPDRKTGNFNQSLYYHAVLQKHGVTEAEFDSSLVYYYTNMDRLVGIYNRLSKRLENEAMSLGASVGDINKYAQYSADGDTANVWTETTSTLLMPEPPYNKFTFDIEADSTYKAGDTFLFQFDTDFLVQDSRKEANVYLVLTYEGDSIFNKRDSIGYKKDSVYAQYSNVRRDGSSQLRVVSDPKKPVKRIKGFIYFGYGNDKKDLRLMFVNRIQLIRLHKVEGQETERSLPKIKKLDDR